MSIEVRQMSIRCQVVSPPAPAPSPLPTRELAALRERLLDECKAMLREQLQQTKER